MANGYYLPAGGIVYKKIIDAYLTMNLTEETVTLGKAKDTMQARHFNSDEGGIYPPKQNISISPK
jgi:hypothetical protein